MFYKYYSATGNGKQNLKEKVICFSDIDKFNDPFEGVGEYLYDLSLEEQEYFNSIGLESPSKILSERFSEEDRNVVRFKQRIWCVTTTYSNDLMWAHYAESHKGFCVGYAEENIRKVSHKFEKVVYCTKPVTIDIRADIEMDVIEGLLFQKGSSWGYEDEWRALYTLQGKDVKHLDYFNYFEKCFTDDPEHLYTLHGFLDPNIPPEVLCSQRYIVKECPPSEVYLGLRMSQEDKDIIIQICKEQQIPAFQMIQVPGSFELDTICVFKPQ